MTGYIHLALAILGELVGTVLLKYTNGFSKVLPTAGALVAYSLCFFFLAKALTSIRLSVAYASWSGLGIVAAALISVFLLNEQLNGTSVFAIILIVTGVVILNMFGSAH